MKRNQKSFCKAIRIFAISIGATAVCMLSCLGFPGLPVQKEPAVLEASVFNGSQPFDDVRSAEAAAGGTPAQVIPLGSAFGIKLFTDGVIVASLSDIYTTEGMCCPAADAGIRPGDYLLEADGQPISGNASLAHQIGGSEGKAISLKVRRGDKCFEVSIKPVFGDGSFKTGMWIRDSAAGIGTLTFYDAATGRFAGLGHGICDMDAGNVMSLKSGEPAPITLCGIEKGEVDDPGRLQGYFSSEESLGSLLKNNETGVYGILNQAPAGEPVTVLSREQVKCGPVKILATLDENGPRLYTAEIQRISTAGQRTKNLVVKITDPRLLELTGGIVQGMSGCPILQNGELAGAVTHVFTDDPAMGYGIFAQTMLEEMNSG